MPITDWFKQLQQAPVGGTLGAAGAGSTASGALANWRTILPQLRSVAGTASGALGATAALPLGAAGLTHMVQRGLPEKLKGKGGLFDTSTAAWGGMGASAGIEPETDEILRANAIFSGNRPVEETVTDQWRLPDTDWGPVRPTEPQPERGKIDMFLQKFGVPPMTQVSDADRAANQQFMQDQGIGRDPQTGRMYGGNWNEASQDFAGKNAPGTSAWGSANFDEMSQNWMDKYGDVEYSVGAMGDMKRRKQARMKQRAAEFAVQQQAQQQERIRNERAQASAANQMTQRQPGMGGAHMSRSVDQGGLGLEPGQAQAVSDANAAAGMGGWGLAYGGRVGYNTGGRVGILSIF